MADLGFVRNEIERMRRQIIRQQWEIRQLKAANISTASAELLLARMQDKVTDLRSKRDALQKEQSAEKPKCVLGGRSW